MASFEKQEVSSVDQLIDERELARITHRSLQSIRRDRLYRRGCPYLKIGSSVRYRLSAVRKYLDALPTFGEVGQ